ncbi:IS30 family transposase [Methylicorpusculum oleiharenae]|nr:IS30 family transposase [Methylicorpusculum oleiharenae]
MISLIEAQVRLDWSPEQVSGWLDKEHGTRLNHERIYQHIWTDKRAGGDLYKHLRQAHKKRRKKYGSKDKRGQIVGRVGIAERPAIVDEKSRVGDWEIDTVIGKNHVEAGVKYVKQNGFYGEEFNDWQALENYLKDWLDTLANQRLHGSTQQQPQVHYDREEKDKMQSYLTPACLPHQAVASETRQVDKTSLISWQSNKYSVPMAYQSAKVGVAVHAGQLLITDLASGDRIAEHVICLEKGHSSLKTPIITGIGSSVLRRWKPH